MKSIAPARELIAMGFDIDRHPRHGARRWRPLGCQSRIINKVLEGRPHVVDAMKNGEMHLVFNTTDGAPALTDSLFDPAGGADDEGSLLHHHGGGRRGNRGHCGACEAGLP